MEYIIKGSHYKEKKLNKKRVFLVIIIILILVVSIFFIIKNNINTAKKAKVNEINETNELNVLVVDKTGENDNQNDENNQKSNNDVQNNEQNEINNAVNIQTVGSISNNFSALTTDELQRFDGIYRTSDPKRIFLTFDDGPTNQVTPFILDLLKKENIKASFFVLGSRVDANPELVKREYEEGHFIANHGYSHSYNSIYKSTDAVLSEYNGTVQSIRNAIGNQEYNSLVFRFPGGSVGGTYDSMKKAAKQVLREQGIASVDWNALSGDAEGIKTKEGLYNRFLQTVSGKSSVVLLMHDAADKILTYETLPDIISYCRQNGYEFRTMYDVILRN